ncbi:MAG: cytochrome b/b6 domain-containing protein [Campylobacterota bacterium]|nr:cytochrome b/b6 domain-containing protein [Campylobacterota bacterium]
MNKKQNQVYVWPLCTRIVHWSIAFSFTIAFILSFFENRLNYHVAVGTIFSLMLVYRFIWGFIGPRYATFNTFKFNPTQLKYYFIEKIEDRYRDIPAGHNPASSWYTLLVLVLGSIIVVTGFLLYGIQEAKGILSFLNHEYSQYSDILLSVHIYTTYILLAWVLIHITGVLIEQFYHKTDMVFAMITGYKKAKGEDAELSTSKNITSYIFLLSSVLIFFVIISSNSNIFVKNRFENIDYEKESSLFYDKCAECHKIYPSFLLTQNSWSRIMDGLDNHFGEKITDNNISQTQRVEIREFLLENSAESSTREIAVKIVNSVKDGRPLAITKTKLWREIHKEIPRDLYKTKKIKDKSNCFACHIDIEKGNLEDINICYNY